LSHIFLPSLSEAFDGGLLIYRGRCAEDDNSRKLRLLNASLFLALIVAALLTAPSRAAEPGGRTVLDLQLGDQRLEGLLLKLTTAEADLLTRDGRLWMFDPAKATEFRKLASTFRGYSAAEMRSRLSQELGRNFEITGTGHYLVAHAPGQRNYWSRRFEELYRSFVRYFSIRGFRLKEPEFPLVAIVFRNQDDFLQYSRSEGNPINSNVLGYYSRISNRIALFDRGGGAADSSDWKDNAATIVHEASHQTAFNTGIHSRFADQPRWVVEGLGTLFEAQGVWDSSRYPTKQDRFNQGRLQQFKQYLPHRPADSLAAFIASDRPFFANINFGYAQAWALSFFLVETRPRQYSDFLERVASREAFSEYPAAERLADFTAAFGSDLRQLESHFLKYMAALK
jgi:hypothetical protein